MSQPDEFTRANRAQFEQHTMYCPSCDVERTVGVRREGCPVCLGSLERMGGSA